MNKTLTSIIAVSMLSSLALAGSGVTVLKVGDLMPNHTHLTSRVDYATIVDKDKKVGNVYAWVIEHLDNLPKYPTVHYDCTQSDNPVAVYDFQFDRMFIDKDYDKTIDKIIEYPRDVKVLEYHPCKYSISI